MQIKALTFDTGGTILDWHGGVCNALRTAGEHHGMSLDWHAVANDYRRLAMKAIVGQVQPPFNMDDVHKTARDLDGRLPQLRSERRPRLRFQDGFCPQTRRMGTSGPARPDTPRRLRHCG